MARLVKRNNEGQFKSTQICSGEDYFIFGRADGVDEAIRDRKVSRFHATIFRSEGGLYLIDHSYNGTFYNLETADFNRPDTRLGSSLDVASISELIKLERIKEKESVLELHGQRRKGIVGLIPDYEKGKFKKMGDIAYLLDMIRDPEQAALLASTGVRLGHDGNIGLVGGRHRYKILDPEK